MDCIVTEKKNENMLIIFKKENETNKNETSDETSILLSVFVVIVLTDKSVVLMFC